MSCYEIWLFSVFKEKTCRSLGLIRHNFSIKLTTQALARAPTVQQKWFWKVLPLPELQNPFLFPPHPHLGLACFLFPLNCGIMHIRFTILAILNYTTQWHLAHSQESCHRYHYLIPEHFHDLRRRPLPLSVIPHLQPLETTNLLSVTIYIPIWGVHVNAVIYHVASYA